MNGRVRTVIASNQPLAHKHRATLVNKAVHRACAALKTAAVSTARPTQIVNVASAMGLAVSIQTNVRSPMSVSMAINATVEFVSCHETIVMRTH